MNTLSMPYEDLAVSCAIALGMIAGWDLGRYNFTRRLAERFLRFVSR